MTGLIAFDADVLIYAAAEGHPLGSSVAELFATDAEIVGVGSVLLLTEVLTKPVRANPDSEETAALISLLSRLDLHPVDETTALLAVSLGASHGLRAADAVHLATAVAVGADCFLTNNRKDFGRGISEIEIVHPAPA